MNVYYIYGLIYLYHYKHVMFMRFTDLLSFITLATNGKVMQDVKWSYTSVYPFSKAKVSTSSLV